ncbi:hypothetical protein HDF11_002098 [Tunturiibacter psychrotolerans]
MGCQIFESQVELPTFKFFESVQNSMTGLYSWQKITVNKKFNELAI